MKELFMKLAENKTKLVTVVGAIFALAAGLGSTLLTPEQRESIITFISTVF